VRQNSFYRERLAEPFGFAFGLENSTKRHNSLRDFLRDIRKNAENRVWPVTSMVMGAWQDLADGIGEGLR